MNYITTGATAWTNWGCAATFAFNSWPVWTASVTAATDCGVRFAAADIYAADRIEYGDTKLRIEADSRADRLLHESLSPKQREELALKGYFEVTVHSKDGDLRTYRIRRGYAGNVTQVIEGRPVRSFCIHPKENIPYADVMLAQKLYLESMEDAFVRIANQTILVPEYPRLQIAG